MPDIDRDDDELAGLMAACDEIMATGALPDALSGIGLPGDLQRRFADDLALMRRLQGLRMRSPTDTPAPAAAPGAFAAVLPAELPTSFGRFLIRRELGSGGFGRVFLAHDPTLGRDVALKVPRAEVLATAEQRDRFRHEALAAARLDHPNIVPVYEAGEVGPVCYIASAYCPGTTLAECLKGQPVPPPWRGAAELMLALADAVQHAHSRGVLHRDLKPANVLVVGGGWRVAGEGDPPTTRHPPLAMPKITDFGLAKLADDSPNQTRSGVVLGTASYMAPEQAEGKLREVGTAADVYSLGAILYELLTGRPPFAAETQLATLQQVRDADPIPPRRQNTAVPRDLETICLKCLQKQPARRYASAAALAEDLRRCLAGEPVLARPVGASERAWKWARRRPVAAVLVAVSLLVFVAAVAAGAWHNARLNWYNQELQGALHNAQTQTAEAQREWKRAEGNLDEAREVVDQLLTRLGAGELAGVPHMEQVRRALLERALRFYQKTLEQRSADPAMRREAAHAHAQVGYIHLLLGNHREALAVLEQAQVLCNDVGAEFPGDAETRNDLADALVHQGQALRLLGRPKEALARFRDAGTVLEAAPAQVTPHPHRQYRTAEALSLQSIMLAEAGELETAQKTSQDACVRFAQVLEGAKDKRQSRMGLAGCLNNLASVLQKRGRLADAIAKYSEAIEIYQTLADEFPGNPGNRKNLGVVLMNLGSVQRDLGRLKDAESSCRRSVDLLTALVADFPAVAEYRSDLMQACYALGVVLHNTGQPAKLEQAFRDTRLHAEWLVAHCPAVPYYRDQLASAQLQLFGLHAQRGEDDEARRCLEQAIIHAEKAHEIDATKPDYALTLGVARRAYAEALLKVRDHRAAVGATQHLIDVAANDATVRLLAASLYCRCADVAEADATLSGDERARLTITYSDRAMKEIGEAVRLNGDAVRQFTRRPDYDRLRRRADFQQLLRELNTNPPPTPRRAAKGIWL